MQGPVMHGRRPKAGTMGCHAMLVLYHDVVWEAYCLPGLDLQVRVLMSGTDVHNWLR